MNETKANPSRVLFPVAALFIVAAVVVAAGYRVEAAREAARAIAAERTAILLLESAPVPLVACAGDGRVIVFNHAAENLTGWERKAMVGGTLAPMLPDGYKGRHGTAMAAARKRLQNGGAEWTESQSIPATLVRADGTEIPVVVHVRGVRANGGEMFVATLIPSGGMPDSMRELRSGQADRWRGRDMERWAEQLQADNPGLAVPKPEADNGD